MQDIITTVIETFYLYPLVDKFTIVITMKLNLNLYYFFFRKKNAYFEVKKEAYLNNIYDDDRKNSKIIIGIICLTHTLWKVRIVGRRLLSDA